MRCILNGGMVATAEINTTTGPPPPVRYAHTELTWDYPGVYAQRARCLTLLSYKPPFYHLSKTPGKGKPLSAKQMISPGSFIEYRGAKKNGSFIECRGATKKWKLH